MGLAANATFDFLKKKMQSPLDKNFSKIYDEIIIELTKKHGWKAKRFIKRFFEKPDIREISLDAIKRDEKMKRLSIYASKIKTPTEKDLNEREIIEELYSLFKNKIHSNANLSSKLHEFYESQIMIIISKTNEKVGSISKTLVDLKIRHKEFEDKLFKTLKDGSQVKVVSEGSGLPFLVLAHQFRIEGYPLTFIKNNIQNFFCFSKEGIEIIAENEKFLEVEYLPDKNNNLIKLSHEGFPYKIIYPPFNKIIIYVERKPSDTIQITVFCSEKKQLKRIEQILLGEIDPRKIGIVSFRKKMKIISKKFLDDLTVFDYDPLIYKPVKLPDGVKIKSKGKRAIIFGEKGFFRRPKLINVLNGAKFAKKNQETDIFFIKMTKTKKISKKEISSIEVEFRGKVAGYFSRALFNLIDARKIIVEFFEKYGLVHFDQNRKHI